MKRFYSLSDYLKETFGRKVYKVALDGGFTCPNRDGTLDTRGCIFCGGGSGAFALPVTPENVIVQIDEGAKKIERKAGKNPLLIAYFQSYTNTYAPTESLDALFSAAISHPQVAVLSVATRPDCLSDEVIALFVRLSKIKPVWIELGLQTHRDDTAEYIRRGYPLSVYLDTADRLRAAGIPFITHMIVGLPGETVSDMITTARIITQSGASGIKIQLLHILEGTDLAEEYRAGRVKTLSMDEYMEILFDILRVLPPDTVVHRMTGDGAKKDLIAPLWSANKRAVRNAITRAMERENLIQGENACLGKPIKTT